MDTRDHKVEKVQARLKEEREALWNGISAANRDLEGRVYRLGIRCEYESETDTLLITVGRRGKQSTTESAFKGLEVRIDSDSYKISALEIVGFAEYFMAHVDPNVKDVKLLNTVAQAVLELYQPKSSISASPSFDKDPARVAPGTPPNKHPSESAKLDGSIRLSFTLDIRGLTEESDAVARDIQILMSHIYKHHRVGAEYTPRKHAGRKPVVS